MNIRQILLALSGKTVSVKKIEELQKQAISDRPVSQKLTKVVKIARANKLNQFKFVVTGAFKNLLTGKKKTGGRIVPFKGKDIAGLDGIESYTIAEAENLGIIDGLGKLAHKDIYKSINDQILKYLKDDDLKFRKAWRDGVKIKGKTYGPQNYVSQNPYRGFNAFAIALNNWMKGTEHVYFLTRKQIAERGGKLKKDAEGTIVAAYIKSEKTTPHPQNPDLVNVEVKQGVVSYIVYPIEHTEGVKPIKRKNVKEDDFKDIDSIILKPQTIIDHMPKAPVIKNGGDKAFYTSGADYVQMPLKKAFDSMNEYYSTLFHELVHSTGHPKRIGRKFGRKFGDKDYAFEELIAELGAAYLCGVSNIEYFTLKNSAAYLKSWSSALRSEMKQDKTFFFRAIMASTKAAKYIIGETLVDQTEGKKSTKSVNKSPEVKPDKTKKASIQAAIKDVLTIAKYKDISPMLAQMLYSDFKENEKVVYDDLGKMKQTMYDKANENGYLEYEIRSGEHFYFRNGPVEDLINSINGRLQTLRSKKQGNDMFPDLAGAKGKKHVIDGKAYTDQGFIDYANKVFYYELQDAGEGEISTVAEAKRIFKAYGDKAGKVKPGGKKKGLSGTMSITEAANSKFELLGLDGQYLKMIGEACKPTSFFIYGPGGSGKSTFTLKFAYYLAQKGNKIAYVAGEQFATPVFSKMLQRLKIQDIPNFVIAKDLNSINPNDFEVIVIDSKDSLELDHLQFQKLQEKYPSQSWAILSQATKDGGFTGSEKWRNLVDTMIYCEAGIAQTGIDKNRWGGKGQIKVY
jgi:antirestriction protein ArdC